MADMCIVLGAGHGVLTLGILEALLLAAPYKLIDRLHFSPSNTYSDLLLTAAFFSLIGHILSLIAMFIRRDKTAFVTLISGIVFMYIGLLYVTINITDGLAEVGLTTGLPFIVLSLILLIRLFRYIRGSKLNRTLSLFIEQARELGLHEADYINAKELLEYNEQGLAFDTVIAQLYDYDIAIDQKLYDLAVTITRLMKISTEEYDHLKELIIR